MVHAIRTDGLSKRYGATLALDRLDLSVSPGEVYGFLGPNGAGKTTAIRLLLGLHRPTAGRAEIFGIDAWRDAVAAHRRVAYVAGEPFLWPGLTAAETLEFIARMRGGDDRAYRDDARRALPPRRRQAGARALEGQPAEGPARRGLRQPGRPADPRRADGRPRPADGGGFRETVREATERGQAVFLSSHILSEVEALCDRVGILRDGRLVDEGKPRGAAPPRLAGDRGDLRGGGPDAAAARRGRTRRRPGRTPCASR